MSNRVLQSGNVTPTHLATWTTDGVIQDSGTGLTAVTTSTLAIKQACRIATTTQTSLAGLQTLQGVTLASGDRVLVAGQTAGAQNGIYVASAGAWLRASDFITSDQVSNGVIVSITAGASTNWVYMLTTANPIVLNTTALTFQQLFFSSPAAQPLTGAEILPVQQSGNTVETTAQNIADLAFTGTALPSLPAATTLTGTEVVYGVQGVTDVKITATQLQTFAIGPPLQLNGTAFVASLADFATNNTGLANFAWTGTAGFAFHLTCSGLDILTGANSGTDSFIGHTYGIGVSPSGITGNSSDAMLRHALAAVMSVEGQTNGTGGTFRYINNSPSTLSSGTINDYNPTGMSYFQRFTANASNSTLTGISMNGSTSQVDGEKHLVVNIATNGTITLNNQDAGSVKTNRFQTSTGAAIVLAPKQAADLIYDSHAANGTDSTGAWLVYKRN